MRLRHTLLLIAVLISGMSLAVEAAKKTWDFESDEPGQIANWIGKPSHGIRGLPFEFEYVRREQ